MMALYQIELCGVHRMSLTLPFRRFRYSHHLPRGGGGDRAEPPAISETVAPMYVKFRRVLETPLKVLEMLKLFT